MIGKSELIEAREELINNFHQTPYTTFNSTDCKIYKRFYLDSKGNIIKIQFGNGSSTALHILSQEGNLRYPIDVDFMTENDKKIQPGRTGF
jgi:hypothetical protein